MANKKAAIFRGFFVSAVQTLKSQLFSNYKFDTLLINPITD